MSEITLVSNMAMKSALFDTSVFLALFFLGKVESMQEAAIGDNKVKLISAAVLMVTRKTHEMN